jgi:hypothetical protein
MLAQQIKNDSYEPLFGIVADHLDITITNSGINGDFSARSHGNNMEVCVH